MFYTFFSTWKYIRNTINYVTINSIVLRSANSPTGDESRAIENCMQFTKIWPLKKQSRIENED